MAPTIAAIAIDISFDITEATSAFTRKSDLIVTPAIKQLQDRRTTIQITNPNAHSFSINHGTVFAKFKTLTLGRANHVQTMSLEQLTLVSSHLEEANNVINQFIQTPNSPSDKQWYPIPGTCEDPTKLLPVERRISNELVRLRDLERLNRMRRAFLDQFSSKNC